RRFHFRVNAGGDTDQASAQYEAIRGDQSLIGLVPEGFYSGGIAGDRLGGGTTGAALLGFSAASSGGLLAQSIRQEQWGEGLHTPPHEAATLAYTRAGAAWTQPAGAGISLTA